MVCAQRALVTFLGLAAVVGAGAEKSRAIAPSASALPAPVDDRVLRYNQLSSQIASLESQLTLFRHRLSAAESAAEAALKSYERVAEASNKTDDAWDAAKARHREARQKEAMIFKELKDRLDTDPRAVAARKQIREAQDALTRERDRVLEPVRKTDAHRKAAEAADKARKHLESRRAGGKLSAAESSAAAHEILTLDQEVNAIESKAVKADADYKNADEKLREARANWTEVQRKLGDAIKVDKDRVAAVTAIAAAQEQANKAEKEAMRMRRTLAAAKADYANADGRVAALNNSIDSTQQLLQQTRQQLQTLGFQGTTLLNPGR